MSEPLKIERKRGDTRPIRLRIQDDNGDVDFSVATEIKLGISDKKSVNAGGGGALLLELDGTDGGSPGWASFSLTQEESDSLAAGRYFGEVEYMLAGERQTSDTVPVRILGDIV